MIKKINVIWYDWNSPSGFELLEVENQRMNEQLGFSKTAITLEVELLSGSTCRCNNKSRVIEAS